MIISFSGLDGTGKSTHVRGTCEYLTGRGIKCRSRHLIKDSFSYFLTHKVVGKVSMKMKDGVETGIRSKKRGPKFVFFAFAKKVLLLLELLYFNARYFLLKNRRNRALICDRYFYDALVQVRYLGISGDIFAGIYKSLIIEPDISFFLHTPPDLAYGRKKEFDMEYFSKKSGLYEHSMDDVGFIILESDEIDHTQQRIQDFIDESMGRT